MTLRGAKILKEADLIVYAASLVDEQVLEQRKPTARVLSSSNLHLEQVLFEMVASARRGEVVARVHSGDPSVYGAIQEQIDRLHQEGIPYEIVPGVSSVFAAAALLGRELTIPERSQTVILTRVEGRAGSIPEGSELHALARHPATLAIFLSAALGTEVRRQLLSGGLPEDQPVVIVKRASWPDQEVLWTTVGDLPQALREFKIHRQALILVGPSLSLPVSGTEAARSRLYDPEYTHLFRRAGGDRDSEA